MAEGLEGLPPWLQAVVAIVSAVGVGGAAMWSYARKKPVEEGSTGALIAQAFANSNEFSKTLESVKRIEGFEEQKVEILDKMEVNQRAAIDRAHALELLGERLLSALNRVADKL